MKVPFDIAEHMIEIIREQLSWEYDFFPAATGYVDSVDGSLLWIEQQFEIICL